MTLRKLGSRSTLDLKSDQSLKSFIRCELKDLINDSVQNYLQKNKIPIATIDIKVDKDCCHNSYGSSREPNKGVRLNISTSTIDAVAEPNKPSQRQNGTPKDEDNLHWMTWKSFDGVDTTMKSKEAVNYRCQTPSSGHRYRCSSPFMRPSTATGHDNKSTECKEQSLRYRPSSIECSERPRSVYMDRAMATKRPMTSVAVGPDRHFEDKAMNTQRSYQVSDYLKKNMDLNDPYERNVYSTLMEVMRKKNHQAWSTDSVVGDADPIIQISEYKHRFQNPRTKIAFPTSNTQTITTVKKPPICPHKTRPLGTLRPQTPSTSKLRFGEQFLF